MIPAVKLFKIEIDQIGNKSDGMTWYQQDNVVNPSLSRSQRRYLQGLLGWHDISARRALPSRDPGGSEFYPSCTKSSSAVPNSKPLRLAVMGLPGIRWSDGLPGGPLKAPHNTVTRVCLSTDRSEAVAIPLSEKYRTVIPICLPTPANSISSAKCRWPVRTIRMFSPPPLQHRLLESK
ncbi:hypothetical protein F5888DRAFT_1109157 [Russula emetica]|nr:hypothetical protein F5888DRAFT_1109157 [Russula emetica]